MELDAGKCNEPETLLNFNHDTEVHFCARVEVSKDRNNHIGHCLPFLEHTNKIIVSISEFEELTEKEMSRLKTHPDRQRHGMLMPVNPMSPAAMTRSNSS